MMGGRKVADGHVSDVPVILGFARPLELSHRFILTA